MPPARVPSARRVAVALGCCAGLVVSVLASGCRQWGTHDRAPAPSAPPDGPARDAAALDSNARLDELASQYLADTAAASPVNATWLGVHGWDDRLDDTSAAAQAREAGRLRRVLERLEELPARGLDAEHRLDRALLERHARLALFEVTDVQALEHNPIRYVSIASSGVHELLLGELDTLPDRLRAIVGRLGRVRPLFDEARKNLSNPSELHTRRAIELLQSTRAFLAETLPKVVVAVGDDRLVADFRAAQGDALRAIDDTLNFFQKDLLARSHGEVALGAARLLERLRLREAVDLPPDALLALLVAASDRELKAAQKRFEEAAKVVAPGRTPPDALRLLDDDHPTAEQLLPAVQQAVEQAWALVQARHLLTLPPEVPQVQPMPPFLWGYALVDAAGPFEPRASYALYVDPVNPSWDRKTKDEHLRAFGRAPMLLFAVHEPLAHRVHAEAVRRSPSTMQRLGVAGAFTEGFPRYLGQLLLDEGPTPGDPRARLAQRREVLLSWCRLVASLRIHALGARLDDAAKLFSDVAWMDDSVARREAERVAIDPMTLDEALGLAALLRLRDDYARARGEAYSPAALHQAMLAHGTLPLALLRRQILGADPGPLL